MLGKLLVSTLLAADPAADKALELLRPPPAPRVVGLIDSGPRLEALRLPKLPAPEASAAISYQQPAGADVTTNHFYVLHDGTKTGQETAEIIAKGLEKAVKDTYEQFGLAEPSWSTKVTVRFSITKGKNNGSTTAFYKNGAVDFCLVELSLAEAGWATTLIPHEGTHVALKHMFGPCLPRPLDEGLAVLAERETTGERLRLELLRGRLRDRRQAKTLVVGSLDRLIECSAAYPTTKFGQPDLEGGEDMYALGAFYSLYLKDKAAGGDSKKLRAFLTDVSTPAMAFDPANKDEYIERYEVLSKKHFGLTYRELTDNFGTFLDHELSPKRK